MALGVLTRESVERAMAEYDSLGRDEFLAKHGFGRATHYALVVNGRDYDPKAIAGVAYGFDHPEEGTLANTAFNGGLQLRGAYRPAGFDIQLRTPAGAHEIRDLVEELLDTYVATREDVFHGSHPTQALLRRVERAFETSGPLELRPTVAVKASAGLGNWARVPWVAFLDERETTSTQHGVYPVLLFREDMSGVYLTVAQGVTEHAKLGRVHMRSELEKASTRVQALVRPELSQSGFALGRDIELRSKAPLARNYEQSTIAYKFYERGRVPSDEVLLRDLDVALNLVDAYVDQQPGETKQTGVSLRETADAFRTAVDASGLMMPTGHGDRVKAFVAALATKPFVILAGLSGSGKTQLVLRLGEWCGSGSQGRRFLPVAVRPDWTGPEAIFGYEDALRPSLGGRAAWFVPDALKFILAAGQEPEMPYLLLLDEMNLAHVERYFSDFLSGVESRDAIVPNLEQGEDGEWREAVDGPTLMPLPRNLFVVGTVNVDETTYQFSPKVLDRATTFEVRTSTAELADLPRRPEPVEAAELPFLRCLVGHAADDHWHEADLARLGSTADALRRLHALLQITDDEFGHRVFYEGMRMAAALERVGVSGRDALLDHVLLLKVLPRIHGSRRRAEPVLRRLAAFAANPDAEPAQSEAEVAGEALPMTLSKVRRMLRSVEVNQFVSFTD